MTITISLFILSITINIIITVLMISRSKVSSKFIKEVNAGIKNKANELDTKIALAMDVSQELSDHITILQGLQKKDIPSMIHSPTYHVLSREETINIDNDQHTHNAKHEGVSVSISDNVLTSPEHGQTDNNLSYEAKVKTSASLPAYTRAQAKAYEHAHIQLDTESSARFKREEDILTLARSNFKHTGIPHQEGVPFVEVSPYEENKKLIQILLEQGSAIEQIAETLEISIEEVTIMKNNIVKNSRARTQKHKKK